MEKADNYPRPLGYIDCHIDGWSVCENGHPFYNFGHSQACYICYHVEFKHPFTPRLKPPDDSNQKGARPKQFINEKNTNSLSERDTVGSSYTNETRKQSE